MHTGRSQCLMETQLNAHWPLPMLNGDSTASLHFFNEHVCFDGITKYLLNCKMTLFCPAAYRR